MSNKITIFGYATGCVFCDMAKRLCTTRQLSFEFIELARDNETDEQLKNRDKLNKIISDRGISQRTFPFVFIDDEFIGGFEDFRNKLI